MLLLIPLFAATYALHRAPPPSRRGAPAMSLARAPTPAELLLATCKAARLPEVQGLPRELRLESTHALVSAAYAALPSVRDVAQEAETAADRYLVWDGVVEGLTQALVGATPPPAALDAEEHEDLVRAVVEVLFGDALLADLAWELLLGAEPAAPRAADAGDSGLLTPAAAFVRVVDGEKRGEVVEELTKQLDLPAERVAPLVEALLRALDDALPWPIRKPLSNKMYDEFERLHAHMKLMVAQALPLPPTTGVPPPTPLTAQQADALVLGVLDVALDELNLYALECAVMALMAASLVDEAPGAGADDSLEAVEASIREHEAELRRLRQRREALAAEGSD